MGDILSKREELEAKIQEFVTANFGDGHYMCDYVISVSVVDMSVEGLQQTKYLHDGKGAFHAMRGLTAEQEDWLFDLRSEENADNEN
jgi:hypothetical protein